MKAVKLGDICELKYGKSLPDKSREAGNVFVFGSNGKVGNHTSAITNGPTVIIGRKGSIGEVNYSNDSCWPIDTTYYVDTTSTKEDLRWLYYALASLRLQELNKATGVPGLNRNDAYEKEIVVPPLKDQKRIAAMLDQADELCRARRKSIDRLNDLSQAIFYEMFGDPALNLKGWKTKKLSAVGSVNRGVSKHRPRNEPSLLGGEHPLIQTGDVSKAKDFITNYSSTYSNLGLSQSKKWPAGTLCITIAANIADTAILTFDACFPDSVVAFQAGSEEVNFFIHNWFKFTKGELERIAPAVAQKNINLAILRDLDVIWPGEDEVKNFYIRTKKINEQRSVHQKSLDELENLFLSIQQCTFRRKL